MNKNGIFISKKIGFGLIGFITGSYLNSFAITSISFIITTQIVWISRNSKTQSNLVLDIDNLIKYYYIKNQIKDDKPTNDTKIIKNSSVPYKSAFITGYIIGIIYQHIYIWLVIFGISTGGVIGYMFNPDELEYNIKLVLAKNKYIRMLFPDLQEYINKQNKTKISYFSYDYIKSFIIPSITDK